MFYKIQHSLVNIQSLKPSYPTFSCSHNHFTSLILSFKSKVAQTSMDISFFTVLSDFGTHYLPEKS